MYVKITPIIAHIRVYSDGMSYENKDPYIFIVTSQFIGDGVAHLSGGKGELNKFTVLAVRNELHLMGVHTVHMDRHGAPIVRKV